MTAIVITDSLQIAMQKRRPKTGLLVHSDHGSQYEPDTYQKLLNDKKNLVANIRPPAT